MSDATGKQSLQVGTVKDCLTDRLLDVVPDLEGDYAVIQEAADEIQSLRARVAELAGAVLAEREACARVCEEAGMDADSGRLHIMAYGCARKIRARGEK